MPGSRRVVVSGLYNSLSAGRRRRPSPKPQASARGPFGSGLTGIAAKDRRDCRDRSSRPHRLRLPTPQAVVDEIERLRRRRWTGKQIAAETGVSPATVSRVLRRLGLNKLTALEPLEPIQRYEREKPGELIHLDIKKLGRIGSVGHRITGRYPGAVNRHHGIGWEFVHVCIDDASRRLRAGPGRLAQGECGRLPGGRRCLFRQAWRPHRARDDGQRLVLPIKDLPGRLQTPRSPPSLHQALHPEDQRKG